MISERSGIEIDYCPACRGVWLDRGELDKILAHEAARQPQYAGSQPHAYDRREPHKRSKSFLEELFD
jgi:Zn-finger nucleic acid-binding protein